ncbi:MAG: 5-nucleotide phosphatase [Arcobacter sp.]|nr:MAG: 5-nucleotide phosphatase [Arcobacter sp.]
MKKKLFTIMFSALSFMPFFAHANESDYLYSTLWFQKAQEYKANTLSQYKLAKLMLDKAILDKSWSAATSVQGKNYENKPLAVVLDLDETVINNSPFSAKLIADNKYYDDEAWNNWQKWVDAAIAPAIPGALDFIKYAQEKNVTVFFVSNRIGTQEKATRKNLLSLGINLPKDIDTVLLKKEKKEWGSKKSTRRAHITKNYRIALLIGDNLGDFSDAYKGSLEDRDKIAFSKENINKWGEKWIILPNPLYGSWETSSYGSDYSLSRKDIRKKMIEKLDIWDGK